MAEEEKGIEKSRRAFLKRSVLGSVAAVGLVREAPGGETAARSEASRHASDSKPRSKGVFFSDAERDAISVLADLVLPDSGAWGAADYIENVLTMFDHDPPRLYAGTVGSTDEWLPIDRIREHAWRLRLHGSDEVEHPNAAIMGPVQGWRPMLLGGAREAARAFARGHSPERVWRSLSADFCEIFRELVLEGALGDPIYGGNREGASWKAFHFEGAMLGYGTYLGPLHTEHDRAGGQAGPDPLSWSTRAALWVMGIFSRLIA